LYLPLLPMVLALAIVVLGLVDRGGPAASEPAVAAAAGSATATGGVEPAVSVLPLYLGHGVGIVATDPNVEPRCSHLFLTTDFKHWRDISPPQVPASDGPCPYVWQSAAFVSPTQGWVLGRNGGSVDTRLFRTVDGGASWTQEPGSATGSNGGTQVIGFTSTTDGWRQQFATGRNGPYLLETTSDGGASWSELPQSSGNGGCMFAADVFATPTDGFAGSGVVSSYSGTFGSPPAQSSIWRTVDGGRSWSPFTLPSPTALTGADAYLGLPTFFTTTSGILPAVYVTKGGRSTVAFSTTSDAGNTWTLLSTVKAGPISATATDTAPDDPACSVAAQRPAIPAMAVASPSTWWVMGPGRGTVEVTSDRGASWASVRTTGLQARGTTLSFFAAANARVAWATTTNVTVGARSFLTTDGGRTWTGLRVTGLRVSGRRGASPAT
jgi:hypothetical protein